MYACMYCIFSYIVMYVSVCVYVCILFNLLSLHYCAVIRHALNVHVTENLF